MFQHLIVPLGKFKAIGKLLELKFLQALAFLIIPHFSMEIQCIKNNYGANYIVYFNVF